MPTDLLKSFDIPVVNCKFYHVTQFSLSRQTAKYVLQVF